MSTVKFTDWSQANHDVQILLADAVQEISHLLRGQLPRLSLQFPHATRRFQA
jgi:hypothetical protein